jgi:gas vesicle protein
MSNRVDGRARGGHRLTAGLFIGVIAGAVAGVLFAPKTGVDLRREVGASAQRFRVKATETYADVSRTAGTVVANGRRAFHEGRTAYHRARGNGAAGDPPNG